MPKWNDASRLPGFKPKAERIPQKGLIKASCTVNISINTLLVASHYWCIPLYNTHSILPLPKQMTEKGNSINSNDPQPPIIKNRYWETISLIRIEKSPFL
jgi:hypothetical protein